MFRSVLLLVLLAVPSLAITRRVLVLGLDGGKSTVISQVMNQGRAPNMLSMVTVDGVGATCNNVWDPKCAFAHEGYRYGSRPPVLMTNYSTEFQWVTSPGWCSVTTGVSNPKHGVKDNDIPHQAVFVNTSLYFPTMFSLARKAGLRTAASGAPAFLSAPNPNDCEYGIVDYECGGTSAGPILDCHATTSCNLDFRMGLTEDGDQDNKTVAFALEHIEAGDADLIMTHFDLIDEMGHMYGWGSPQQLDQVAWTDGRIGWLLDAVRKAAAARNESWLVMLTADHGGHFSGHDKMFMEDEVVPLYLAVYGGEGVKLRPLTYPVRHFDVAPTALAWLQVPRGPGPLDGTVQSIPY